MATEWQKLVCSTCGGQLVEKDKKRVCKHCGSAYEAIEKISEEEVVALNRATTDRQLLRFDEALEEYNLLLKKYPDNEMANWGALLCDYGIIYEQDYNGEYIPTCHRLNERPIKQSPYYKKLSAEHKESAEKIERLRCSIAEKAKKIQPYDVFICYKATEEKNGMNIPTRESKWARDIYEKLTNKYKLRVFFAEKSLVGSNIEYEPHIYAALKSAKLMFVLTTSIEHVNATWVANEWKRYSKYIRDGEEKTLRVVYDNVEPYDLPKELQKAQAIDQDSDWMSAVQKSAEDIFKKSKKAGLGEEKTEVPKKKNFIAIFLPIVAILIAAIITVSVIDTTARKGLTMELSADSTYYIVTDCPEDKTEVVIPDTYNGKPVKEIANSTFNNCNALTSITIPNSVTTIGASVFNDCHNLTSAICSTLAIEYLPKEKLQAVVLTGGESIENYSFNGCSALAIITIPDTVTSIGAYAFSECNALTNIVIPDSVNFIGASAFSNCESLISASCPIFATEHLPKENLQTLVLTSGSTIGDYMFAKWDNLTNVTISDAITSIGASAFEDCKKLESITIADSVTSIGTYAFLRCYSLKTIAIPSNIDSISLGMLYDCDSLSNVVIPNGVTSIGANAFSYCDSLANVTIPDSVTFIGTNAFSGCDSLKSVNCPTFAIKYIPKGNLQTVVFTSGESISDSALKDCSGLMNVTIPDSVTSIGNAAFYGCTRLTTIKFNGTKEQWGKISKGTDWKYAVPATEVVCTDGIVAL